VPSVNYIWNVVSVALGINSMPSGFGDLYRDWFNVYSGRDVMIGYGLFGKRELNLAFKEYGLGILIMLFFFAYNLVNKWAKLQKNGLCKCLLQGATRMAQIAREIIG
jgi:hypothetical protein